ncbi:MAG: ornithine carbamoyltransferase [Planctomycetaceae bacterium]|nr:MAG: ornithine carbamoyltransferase [Planctomycetaceae bacterium]
MRHVLTLFELTAAEIQRVFEVTEELKTQWKQGQRQPLLAGRVMGLLFEKPSLRTRVSFETGMAQLGGSSLFLGEDVGWGTREALSDFSRVLSQYVDVLVCRAKAHRTVESLAEHATCPVINGLTDLAHPCQALADLYTMREIHGELAGQKLAYIGDANNVASSLLLGCARLGVQFAIASPPGYDFDPQFVAQVKQEHPQMEFLETRDPIEAVRDASAVYTDVWVSMGQEAQRDERVQAFADYQVNQDLMQQAAPNACFLHCLPARRGEEVTDQVLDGPQSAVVQQAGNRMHAQKGLLAWLLGAAS